MHLIFPISKFEAQLLVTSQIRSRIKYLILNDNILMLLYTQIWLINLAQLAGFQYYLMIIREVAYFLSGHPVFPVVLLCYCTGTVSALSDAARATKPDWIRRGSQIEKQWCLLQKSYKL